ncbi:uncharacterized protein LOC120334908 [Styela clava]
MRSYFVIFFVLIGQFAFTTLCFEHEFEIPEGWVDHTDMLNFDYATKTNKKTETQEETSAQKEKTKTNSDQAGSNTEAKPEPDEHKKYESSSTIEEQENKRKFKKSDLRNEKEFDPSTSSECKHPFLRRFVGVLHSKLKHVGTPPHIQDYNFAIHLNSENWLAVEEFAEDCKANVQEVTKVLEDMLLDVHVSVNDVDPQWVKRFEDIIHMPFQDFLKLGVCVALLVAILTLEFISKISWTTQIKRLVILLFLISLAMTYVHELKLAEAEHKSKSTDIPKECLGKENEDNSYWKSLSSVYNDMFSVKKDPCAEYHANFLISPHIRVTPTKVIAVTLTRFLVEPMEHIGTAFSKSFKNVFQGLPITLWIPAFIFVVLIILGFLLIISVFFGYNFSFNLPFWTGLQMGPQQTLQHNPQLDMVLEDNRRHIDQLQETIRELRERPSQQALPAPRQVSPSRAQAILGYFGLGGRTPSPEPSRPPPPYPQQQAPENDLPYPNFNSPAYPRENEDLRIDPQGYRPFQSGYNDPGSTGARELRRRHTVPGSRGRPGFATGDVGFNRDPSKQKPSTQSALPYPVSSENQARRPFRIGFEQFLNEDSEDDLESESKISPPVIQAVEEVQKPTVARSVTETTTPNTAQVESNYKDGESPEKAKKQKLLRDEAIKPKKDNPEPSTIKPPQIEPETLPMQDIAHSKNDIKTHDNPLEKGENIETEDWVKVPETDKCCDDEKCIGDRMNSVELANVFQREAEEGFASKDD